MSRRTSPDERLDRAACERRVYRLATLLTGKPVAATKVIRRVLDAQPDLRSLDGAHMDRLTVLRSREISAGRIVDERLPPASAAALASLTSQQREAWIFRRVYEMGPRDAARSMDCSATAAGQHLEVADLALREAGVDLDELARRLRAYSTSIDVPTFYRAREASRRRRRRLARLAVAAALVLGLALVAWRWLR